MTVASVWQVIVPVHEAQRGDVSRELEAGAADRARIAEALGVDEIKALTARVTVGAWLDGAEVRGRWKATVTQTCGVSLEPFDTEHSGDFSVRLLPQGSVNAPTSETEIDIDPEAEDPPEIFQGEGVDIGGLVVEHLAVEIDPYPRRPGVEFEAPPEENPPSPFAVLGKLKTD